MSCPFSDSTDSGSSRSARNRVVGWEPGYNELQPGHHGWVSSHTLAVIAHATPANGFVGYALTSIDREGRMDYEYFDRYPVFFSAGMHALLSWKPRLSTQIYLAKQAMNGIFLLTLAAAYLVLRQLSLSPVRSLTAAVLAVSSPYLLFYKDMVHYDQPAVLGMLLLVLAIAWTKVNGRRYFVVGATLLAVSLGRGYASLVILLVWLVLEAIEVLQRKAPFSPDKVRALLSLTSLRAAILGTVWAGLNLAYNIHVEATRRGVALLQTGIVG
ncbi:MAG: putative rane protein, partial [Anaerolineales bacterium]|nr:putative rane protein [Anaerolineales bacterium]